MATPILYDVNAEVPEVVDLTNTGQGIYWTSAKVRSATRYAGSFWSQDGLDDWVAELVNNGDIANVAFKWRTGAGTSRAILTLATATEMRECRWSYDTTGAALEAPTFEYSDNGSSWTAVTASVVTTTVTNGTITTKVARWSTPGTHLYWSANRASGTAATSFTELFFRAYGAASLDIEEVHVINQRNGGPELYTIIDADNPPTVTKPLSVTPIYRNATFEDPNSGLNILVRTVARDVPPYFRRDSEGVVYSVFAPSNTNASRYAVQNEVALTGLTNGLNSNVNISDNAKGPCSAVINGASGITGNFSIGGFYYNTGAGFPFELSRGSSFRLWNWTTYTMTIVHQDASSTAAYRIKTLTAANVDVIGNGYADFELSNDQGRWIFLRGRDSTGLK